MTFRLAFFVGKTSYHFPSEPLSQFRAEEPQDWALTPAGAQSWGSEAHEEPDLRSGISSISVW